MVWLLWWVQARSPQLQDDPSLVWTIIFSWQENEHNSQLPHQAFCPQSPLLSPDFRREFQWAKIAALFLYILSSGIFCRIFWWCTDLSFLMRTWACPDAQPYSHEGTFKPWFHSHALDKTLFLDLSWGVSEPNITLCRASGVTERKQNWVLQPLSLLCCLKDLGKTLDQIKWDLVSVRAPRSEPAQHFTQTFSLVGETAEDIPSAVISTCYIPSVMQQHRGNSCSNSTPCSLMGTLL